LVAIKTDLKVISLTVLLSVLSACSSKPYVVDPMESGEITASKEIYIVSHGWHTGFVVPTADIETRLPKLKDRFGDIPNIEFGWGDKKFYQAKEVTTGLTLQAVFWPTDSVVHVVAVPANVEEYFPHSTVEKICLNTAEYFSLITFISNSFEKNPQGEIMPLKNGIYGNSQFYAGEGDYYLFNTCNKWTAKGLKSAGVDISPLFKLTASSVMNYIQKHHDTLAVACL